MRKRIFLGLLIPESIKRIILEWRRKYSDIPVRWIKSENLHITIIPPWYEENIIAVSDTIKKLNLKIGCFDIEFKNVCYGPNPQNPRLIWAEGKTPKQIAELKSQLEKAVGIRQENRNFKLHLTIARFNPKTFSSFRVKRLNEEVCWRDTITQFALFESILSKNGAEYKIIDKFSL